MGSLFDICEPYRAYFLPHAPKGTRIERVGEAEVEFVEVTADDIELICSKLIEARSRLAKRSARSIAEALDEVALAWLSDAFLFDGAVSAAEKVTGYSRGAIELGLRNTLERLRFESLWEMLHEELREPAALDGWVKLSEDKRFRLMGHSLTLHVLAGNIPAIGIASIACALLSKSSSLVKVSFDEPVLTAMFAHALSRVDDELASCIAVVNWHGGDEAIESTAFKRADAVIAYGSMETIQSIRNRLPPTKRFFPYGHKIGVGIIDSHCDLVDAAQRLANEMVMFDQQGCMSPHVVFVCGESGDEKRFAECLSSALEALPRKLLHSRYALERSANIQSWRAVYMMAGAEVIARRHLTEWTIVLLSEPIMGTLYARHLTCPPRTVLLRSVQSIEELRGEIEPFVGFISVAGCSICKACEGELLDFLSSVGIPRICALGEMQLPRKWWFHDGRPNVADLLIWVGAEF